MSTARITIRNVHSPTHLSPIFGRGPIARQIVKVEKDIGAGYVPVTNVHVSFSVTDFAPANSTLEIDPSRGLCTCANSGTNVDSNGECTIDFYNAELVDPSGKNVGHASCPNPIGAGTINTNGVLPNSGDASMFWTLGGFIPRIIRRR